MCRGAAKSAVPAVTAPAQVCGGCFGVADVLGVVFGDEIITQLHTQVISIGLGNNGTNVTRTTILTGQSQFTFNSGGVVGSASPGGQTNFYSGSGGTITLAGVELYVRFGRVDTHIANIFGTSTSPTAYNVFTAYSITSTLNSDGQCITVQGTPVQVSPASSYAIPSGADYALFAQEAEQSFINDIGFPTCSPGGENAAVPTTHVQVTESTVTSTTSGPIRPTPQPVSVSTVAPTTTSASPISIISILASSSVSSSSRCFHLGA